MAVCGNVACWTRRLALADYAVSCLVQIEFRITGLLDFAYGVVWTTGFGQLILMDQTK
jgi:hypothetical protein